MTGGRRTGGRTGASLLALGLLGGGLLTGCGSSRDGVAIVPAGAGAGGGSACVQDGDSKVCVTPGSGSQAGPVEGSTTGAGAETGAGTGAGGTPSAPATQPAAEGGAWGGGERVGTYPTRGTVTGAVPGSAERRSLTGTCDLAGDVRTITAKVDRTATLTIDVTGSGVADITLRISGGVTRTAEYIGDAEVAKVITLTPTRTTVHGAVLRPTGGSSEPDLTLGADFDC